MHGTKYVYYNLGTSFSYNWPGLKINIHCILVFVSIFAWIIGLVLITLLMILIFN